MIKRINGCKNTFEKSFKTKVGEQIPCGYSLSTIWTSDDKENKYDVYRGEDCRKKFCESSREQTMKTVIFEKKKAIPLTNEQIESCEKTKICYFCKKPLITNTLTKKVMVNLRPLLSHW